MQCLLRRGWTKREARRLGVSRLLSWSFGLSLAFGCAGESTSGPSGPGGATPGSSGAGAGTQPRGMSPAPGGTPGTAGVPGAAMGGTPAAPNGTPAGTAPESPPAVTGEELLCKGGSQEPGPSLIRRLTRKEYVNTLKDLLGVDAADLAAKLPRDTDQDGFTNDAAAQAIGFAHIETYAALADEVTRRVPKTFYAQAAGCAALTPACEDALLDNLGGKLLRRPLPAEERAALTPLVAAVKADGGTFEDAGALVLTALLQAPRFLYLVEARGGAGGRALDAPELATRLSYLITGSTPDAALTAAATSGELLRPAGLAAQVDRLLATDRARKQALVFLDNWLGLGRLEEEVQHKLGPDMRAETEGLFDRLAFQEKKPLQALLDAPTTTVSPALAMHYRLPGVQANVATYDLTRVPGRRGLLTHASVLSAGGATDPSLVLRGYFLMQTIVCAPIAPPPIGVNNGRPPTEPGKPQRAYAEQRMNTEPCGGCHRQIDPIAFAFETFSGLGQRQEKDAAGNPLRTDGVLRTPYEPNGRPFANTEELLRLLATDARVADCLVMKPAQYAFARALQRADACTLAAVKEAVGKDGLTYKNIIKHLALQPAFRMLRSDS